VTAPHPELTGADPREGILAVHHAGDSSVDLYVRNGETTSRETHAFYPFFFLTDPSLLPAIPGRYWVKELEGNNAFSRLAVFTSWSQMWNAVHAVLASYNRSAGAPVGSWGELPVLYFRPDPSSQFLMQKGMTLFKGMEFDDLRRMQIDIQAAARKPGRTARSPESDGRILAIGLSDNRGWERVLSAKDMREEELLAEMLRLVREKDPDVIEGHNLFHGELAYLLQRCAFHKLDLALGRDGSAVRPFDMRGAFAEQAFDVTGFEAAGRHLIDTRLLVQSYDASKRALENLSLAHAARHFGIGGGEAEGPEGSARENAGMIRQVSAILAKSLFYLTRILPCNFGPASRMGSSAKIEALLVREYLRRRTSLPRPDPVVQTGGGYTDVFWSGVLGPVLEIDIVSLYPSIMLSERISPRTEPLGVFLSLLGDLAAGRTAARAAMQRARSAEERSTWDAMQSSYKILLNSFYGYLGYGKALFSDARAADRVTEIGQSILRGLMKEIDARGGRIVEVDTDGIYFVPPAGVAPGDAEKRLVDELGATLPPGITLALRGRHERILSYKKKNYALLDADGSITVRGSSLNSRSHEKFARTFLARCIRALLDAKIAGIHEAYVGLHRAIAGHGLAIGEFARTETLNDGPDAYLAAVEEGSRNPSASYEVALAAGIAWRPGERISWYMTGNQEDVRGFEHARLVDEWNPLSPDENVPYYLRRLDDAARKLEPFFTPRDFRAIFSVEDLFPFSDAGMQILTRPVERGEPGDEEDLNPGGGATPTL
jgi:DNA polymerase elongation subunit (family B)